MSAFETIASPARRFHALEPGSGPNRLLRIALLALYVVFAIKALLGTILIAPRFAVDLEISLRAAERWVAGGEPYLASAFASAPGATQPFLYPPYILPILTVLASVPREIIGPLWIMVMLVAAVWTARRLGVPWVWVPLVLAWPPFAEGIVAANVQILLFAAFVGLFWTRSADPWRPHRRDVENPSESGALMGGLAVMVGAIKVSQPHPWIYLVLRRRRAAIAAGLVAGGLAAVTLLATGLPIWFDWIAQLRLAGDPSWDLGGIALARFLPPGLGLLIAALCIIAIPFVPRSRAGEAIGVLSVLGTLSLHTFGMLFLFPAMLMIRRELALIAAIFITTYSYIGSWSGIAICAVAFAASLRAERLREPPWDEVS